jgi:hypothetical protein
VPRLALRFEPELAAVDRLLDDDALLRPGPRRPGPAPPRTAVTGRPSTPVEVVVPDRERPAGGRGAADGRDLTVRSAA